MSRASTTEFSNMIKQMFVQKENIKHNGKQSMIPYHSIKYLCLYIFVVFVF